MEGSEAAESGRVLVIVASAIAGAADCVFDERDFVSV